MFMANSAGTMTRKNPDGKHPFKKRIDPTQPWLDFLFAKRQGAGLGYAPMRCPYCESSLEPTTPECPACSLTFPRTCALVGALPRLNPVVADTTQSLRLREQKRIRRRIGEMQARFPELVVQVVMHGFPQEHPFTMHAFWLFNAGAFAGEGCRGRHNRALMLAVDPARGEAAVIPGYGLERLLRTEALAHLLELAGPAWEEGRWADGILGVLDGIERLLETAANPLETGGESNGEF
jgi:uncharacterized membrane protein YgcG